MRIAIVGPAHPYKGGIAQETTELAHRLTAAGNEVTLLSWKAQYPKLLYPGDQYVPHGKEEVRTFADTRRELNWKNPVGWARRIRKLRSYDQIIFIWWVPTIQGPVYWTMLKALGKHRPKITVICHNVLPHEPRPGDKTLARKVLGRVDRVIVHTEQQAALAKELTASEVSVVDLPPVLPKPVKREVYTLRHTLLFFGIVRTYKGLDVLLKALAEVPDIKLVVAGEFWNSAEYERLIADLDISSRVQLQKGYVSSEDLPDLFAGADALVLPYRKGTATYSVAMAHNFGLPVIATTAGSLAKQVNDNIDGMLCPPDNVVALAATINKFYEPGIAARLQSHVPKTSLDADWQHYVAAVSD